MIKEIQKEADQKMSKAIDALRHEFASIRTGRASIALLDGIKVNYYNTLTPLNQMANLTIPEPRMIVIMPWDPSTINEIEKTILKSDLGINPTNDGKVIRLAIPQLTEERRKQLVKIVKSKAEESKISIRNIRRDTNERLKNSQKEKKITEDDYHGAVKDIQKLTDSYIEKIDSILKDKEEEIMEV
ncbi:MAG: ribosome recycling factor [bacterium]